MRCFLSNAAPDLYLRQMLTRDDFEHLTDHEKAEAVWRGTFLADREDAGHKLQLYSLDSFYVEVSYCPEENRITAFRAFTQTQQLAPYLAQVKFGSR